MFRENQQNSSYSASPTSILSPGCCFDLRLTRFFASFAVFSAMEPLLVVENDSNFLLNKPKLYALFAIQAIAGLISVITNFFVCRSAWNKLRRGRLTYRDEFYTRLMFAMSLFNMLCCLVYVVCGPLQPSDSTSYHPQHPFAQDEHRPSFFMGNDMTCNGVAFFRVSFGLGSLLYAVTYGVSGLLTALAKTPRFQMRKSVQMTLLWFPVVWGLGAGLTGLVMDMYGARSLMCVTKYWVAEDDAVKKALGPFLLGIPSGLAFNALLVVACFSIWRVYLNEQSSARFRSESVSRSWRSSITNRSASRNNISQRSELSNHLQIAGESVPFTLNEGGDHFETIDEEVGTDGDMDLVPLECSSCESRSSHVLKDESSETGEDDMDRDEEPKQLSETTNSVVSQDSSNQRSCKAGRDPLDISIEEDAGSTEPTTTSTAPEITFTRNTSEGSSDHGSSLAERDQLDTSSEETIGGTEPSATRMAAYMSTRNCQQTSEESIDDATGSTEPAGVNARPLRFNASPNVVGQHVDFSYAGEDTTRRRFALEGVLVEGLNILPDLSKTPYTCQMLKQVGVLTLLMFLILLPIGVSVLDL